MTTLLDRLAAWWHELTTTTPRVVTPQAPPPLKHSTPDILEGPPMVDDDTLRDWMIHHHRRVDRENLRSENVWQQVVAEFYNRVQRDRELVDAYFHRVDLDRLQVHFMRALVVITHIGLTCRMAEDLRVRHAHLGITEEHFDRVVGILLDVLTDYGVPRVAIPQLGNIAAALKRRLVTA